MEKSKQAGIEWPRDAVADAEVESMSCRLAVRESPLDSLIKHPFLFHRDLLLGNWMTLVTSMSYSQHTA